MVEPRVNMTVEPEIATDETDTEEPTDVTANALAVAVVADNASE